MRNTALTKRMLPSLASMLLCGVFTPKECEAQTRGDFSLSCNNIQLNARNPKTVVLTANCKKAGGSIHSGASIDLNQHITNDNGNLRYVGTPGDFSSSCNNLHLNAGNPKTAVLSANCKKADGSIHVGGSIDLNGFITNDNGNLRYLPTGGEKGPGGGTPTGGGTLISDPRPTVSESRFLGPTQRWDTLSRVLAARASSQSQAGALTAMAVAPPPRVEFSECAPPRQQIPLRPGVKFEVCQDLPGMEDLYIRVALETHPLAGPGLDASPCKLVPSGRALEHFNITIAKTGPDDDPFNFYQTDRPAPLYDQHWAFWITGPDGNKTTVCRAIFTTQPARVCESQQCDPNQQQPKRTVDQIRKEYRDLVAKDVAKIGLVLRTYIKTVASNPNDPHWAYYYGALQLNPIDPFSAVYEPSPFGGYVASNARWDWVPDPKAGIVANGIAALLVGLEFAAENGWLIVFAFA